MTGSDHGVHPLVRPIAFLLGEWEGEGKGLWDDSFRFADRLAFSSDGRPLVRFLEETIGPGAVPSHGESGYLLAKDNGVIHMTVAEPSGVTEALTGTASGERIELFSTAIALTPSTPQVSATSRRLYLDGGHLIVEIDIGLRGEAPRAHTRSVLQRRT